MKVMSTHFSSSSYTSLISFSSCAIFLLTTIIGNFGVSDADVVLRQRDEPVPFRRGETSTSRPRGHEHSSFNSLSSTSSSTDSVALNNVERQPNQKLANPQFTTRSASNDQLEAVDVQSSADVDASEEEIYFRLLPLSTSARQSDRQESLHKRGVRSVDDLRFLEENTNDREGGPLELGYPLPLSMDDYWALDRDRLLDQLVIRALANPDEWTELRKAFEKVDGDLKALLTLEKGKNQAIPEGTVTNSSLGIGKSVAVASSSSSGLSTSSGSGTASSSSIHNEEHQSSHHHGLKWKFAYHRVHDLNSRGQPTSRGIAAVVSLDTPTTETVTTTVSDENKNGTAKYSASATFKDSSATSTFLFAKGEEPGSKGKEMAVVAASSSSLSAVSSHFDDPIQMLISRGGVTSTAASRNISSNNNIISNSFNRFGNKGKHVDLASDKSDGSSVSDDNSGRKSSNSMPEPSALVLPTERVSQGNEPNSHKIQWDPRHEPGGRGGDEELSSASASFLLEKKEKELVVPRQQYEGTEEKEGENNDNHQHHHHARHHHHQHRRDHYFLKNYHRQPRQHQYNSKQPGGLRNQDTFEMAKAGSLNVLQEKTPSVDFVGGAAAVDDDLFFLQNGNHRHYPSHELSPPPGQVQQQQQQHSEHYFHHQSNNNHNRNHYWEDDHVQKQLKEHNSDHHQHQHRQHFPHREQSSSSWKRLQVNNAAKDTKEKYR